MAPCRGIVVGLLPGLAGFFVSSELKFVPVYLLTSSSSLVRRGPFRAS